MRNKSGKMLIKCQDDAISDRHPRCLHGPTLLFYAADESPERGYYACSAHRDKRDCSFYVPASEITEQILAKRYELPLEECRAKRELWKRIDRGKEVNYCVTCNVPLLPETQTSAHVGHDLRTITPDLLEDPTRFLQALQSGKSHAQYFFDEKALKFFVSCFTTLGITKVVCMGAPRLHVYLRNQCPFIKSFLLDLDNRFYAFFEDQEYAWYNMCNNYFFDEKQELKFHEFLKMKDNERVLLFTDPPFGCRTEPIANTLHQLTELQNHLNTLPHQPLPIFWIFPYFSEHYIQDKMPEMEMCEYKVNYANHSVYTNTGGKRRKLGSPVRIFTNVPMARLLLPVEEEYKYCAKCDRYTSLENRHCEECGVCPSKNGSTYVHCSRCGICVKPNYVHCDNCRRCTQAEGHDCQEYQSRQRCWICLQVGHIEPNCMEWLKRADGKCPQPQTSGLRCLLCGFHGHNERKCRLRSKYVEESTFLGETTLKFVDNEELCPPVCP